MPNKQPVIIQSGSFVCTIYDAENLIALPLANIRKLWKIMFSAEHENKDTIQTIGDWLPQTVVSSETAIAEELTRHWQVVQYTNALHSKMAALGSTVTKAQKAELKKASTVLRYSGKRAKDAKARHERAKKLQTIFNNLSIN